jgi:tetratricopeptide (TPR) repeat protein
MVVFGGLAAVLVARPAWNLAVPAYEVYRARSALLAADPEGALEWLRLAEARQPDRAEVQYLLATAHRRAGQLGEVMKHLQHAGELGWPKKDLKRQRMMMLFEMGDVRAAEPYLQKLLAQGANDGTAEEVYEALVRGYLTEFRVREAVVCLDLWIAWRPRSIPPRHWRTEVYRRVRDAPRLQAELNEILRIEPCRASERVALGESLLESNQVEQALDQFESCRRQAPKDARVLVGLGLCRHRLGRHDEAQRDLEAALAMDTDDVHRTAALVALGELATEAGELETAVDHFQQASRLSPADPRPRYALGSALSQIGRADLAKPSFERWRALSDQNSRMLHIVRELVTASNDTALRLEAAEILLDQGRKEEAVRWLLSALRYHPTLREAHAKLADYFDDQGDVQRARRHRDAAKYGAELAEATP